MLLSGEGFAIRLQQSKIISHCVAQSPTSPSLQGVQVIISPPLDTKYLWSEAVDFVTFDAEYLVKLRAGEASTQRHFVEYFSELIHLKLRSRLSSQEAIEDVRQETFSRVLLILRKEDGLRQAERLGAFVNSVCNHVLQEQYRTQKKSGSSLAEGDEAVYVDYRPSPLNQLESADQARVVRESLSKLPARDRMLLQSVLVEERDKDQLCEEMGVTREYLRVLLHRAKQSFRSAYENPHAFAARR
jgi:RNA polymerase sigma-70 factor (ECF subfamily)